MSLFSGRAAVPAPAATELRLDDGTTAKVCLDPRACCNRARAAGKWLA